MTKKQQRPVGIAPGDASTADAIRGALTVAEQIAQARAILVRHAIIADAASWLPLLPGERRWDVWTLADAVQALVPEHTVFFDMECVYADRGYSFVIECLTHGEWQPHDIAWNLNRRGATVEVAFRSGRERVRWQFPQDRDWVTPAFLGRLGKFLADRLTGEFVPVPRWGQSYMAVYLPRRASQELRTFFQSLPEPELQDGVIF